MLPFEFTAKNTTSSNDNVVKMEQIWDEYHGLMMWEARKVLDEHTAKDAVSESCIRIMNNLDKITEINSPQTKAYIVTIVKNVSIDILRKTERERGRSDSDDKLENTPDDSPDILDAMVSKEGWLSIKVILSLLPEEQREVIYLHAIHGHTHKEIAIILSFAR